MGYIKKSPISFRGWGFFRNIMYVLGRTIERSSPIDLSIPGSFEVFVFTTGHG